MLKKYQILVYILFLNISLSKAQSFFKFSIDEFEKKMMWLQNPVPIWLSSYKNIDVSRYDSVIDKNFESFEKIAALAIEQQQVVQANSAQENAMQIQKKYTSEQLEKMSDAEKMKMAMEMQAIMLNPAGDPNAPLVAETIMETNNEILHLPLPTYASAEASFDNELGALKTQHDELINQLVGKINHRTNDGQALIIMDSDSVEYRKLCADYFAKYKVILDSYLSKEIGYQTEMKKVYLPTYKKFDADLQAIHFGDDLKNPQETNFKGTLAGTQLMLLNLYTNCSENSKNVFHKVAKYYATKYATDAYSFKAFLEGRL